MCVFVGGSSMTHSLTSLPLPLPLPVSHRASPFIPAQARAEQSQSFTRSQIEIALQLYFYREEGEKLSRMHCSKVIQSHPHEYPQSAFNITSHCKL